jgi:hypothetical protein
LRSRQTGNLPDLIDDGVDDLGDQVGHLGDVSGVLGKVQVGQLALELFEDVGDLGQSGEDLGDLRENGE